MDLFKHFNKGIQKAKNEILGANKEETSFTKLKEQIIDKDVSDESVALNLKKFIDTSLDKKEIDEIMDLFIIHRPEAVNKLINKK